MMMTLLVFDIAIQSMNSGRWLDAMNSIMETMHIKRHGALVNVPNGCGFHWLHMSLHRED